MGRHDRSRARAGDPGGGKDRERSVKEERWHAVRGVPQYEPGSEVLKSRAKILR